MTAIRSITPRTHAPYLIYPTAGGYVARNGLTGLDDYAGTDPGAVINSAIAALGAAGGDIRLDGAITYTSTVPGLPRSLTGKLRILGTGRTVLTLASGAPRAFDFNKIAAGDTFRHIELGDFKVNAASIGGQHHIVCGTYISGSNQTRMIFDDIYIHDIQIVNATTDTTDTIRRYGIWIAPATAGVADSLTNIRVTDIRQDGGNAAVAIAGVGTGGGSVRLTFDNISTKRIRHYLGAGGQPNFFGSSCVQIGSHAQGGYCEIMDCYSQSTGDVAYEVDNFTECKIDTCIADDPHTCSIYFTNFDLPLQPEMQTLHATDCYTRRTVESTAGSGYTVVGNSKTIGDVKFTRCDYEDQVAGDLTIGAAYLVTASGSEVDAGHIMINDALIVHNGVNVTNASNRTPSSVNIAVSGATKPPKVTIRTTRVKVRGTRTGTGTLLWHGITLRGGTSTYPVEIDVDGYDIDYNVSNTGSIVSTAIQVGTSWSAQNYMYGKIDGVTVSQQGADTGPTGVSIAGTATLTIVGGVLRVGRGDFTRYPSGGRPIIFAGVTNAASVVLAENSYQYATAAPTAGAWPIGARVWNKAPTSGGNIGWVCTTAGSPGTWNTFGAVS